MTTLTELKDELESHIQNGKLELTVDLIPSQNIIDFIETLPGDKLILSQPDLQLDEGTSPSTLTVTGQVEGNWLIKGIESDGLQDIAIILNFSQDEDISPIEAELAVENSSLEVPGSDNLILAGNLIEDSSLELRLASGNPSDIALESMADFVSNGDMVDYLPQGIDLFVNVPLTELNLQFGLGDFASTIFNFTSDINSVWTIIESLNIDIDDVGVSLDSEHEPWDSNQCISSFSGNIFGQITIGTAYDIGISFQGEYAWAVHVIPQEGNLPTLDAIAGFIGGSDLQTLVSNGLDVLGIDEIAIDGIDIGFDIYQSQLKYASMRSHITLCGMLLELYTRLPEFEFGGALAEGSEINSKDLVEAYFGSVEDDFPDVSITVLSFSAYPSAGNYTISCAIESDWLILGSTEDGLSLTGLELNLDYSSSETLGAMTGSFAIAEANIFVTAEYLGQQDGWKFTGTTVGSLTIGDIISLFTDSFGVSGIPDFISDISLESLYVEFETISKNFIFTCEGIIPLGAIVPEGDYQEGVYVTIDFNLTRQDTSYEIYFAGQIIIYLDDEGTEKLVFELYFEQSSDSNSIVAKLLFQESTEGVTLGQLLDQFSPELGNLVPDELLSDFQLTAEMILVLCKSPATPSKTSTSKYKFLFGIDFSAQIALGDIPLVQNILPADLLSGGFGFEFLVALDTFSQAELEIINNLLLDVGSSLIIRPPSSSINQLEKGASIGAHFNIGEYGAAWLLSLRKSPGNNSPGAGTYSLPSDNINQSSLSARTATADASEEPLITLGNNGVWLTVQKSFGPLYFEQVGLVYKQGAIHLTPIFVVEVSRLALTLNGLSISSPLTEFSPRFNLQGFGLEVVTKSFEIGGMFLLVSNEVNPEDGSTFDEFLGTAVVSLKTGKSSKKSLSISTIAGFADFDDSSKFGLFLYAAINYPLGGPGFFFVTGLSGGFGYNYDLNMPSPEELMAFPFVDEAVNQDQGQIDPAETAIILAEELQALAAYMPPKIGAGFGTVGLKFTCYKIIDGAGMVTMVIDSSLELDFVALVTLMLPTTLEGPYEPIAVAEMLMQGRFAPSEGVLLVQGQLTPNSYFLSRECHLTGGFAYQIWFSGERAGDFVKTQGGYHPRFSSADRYPDVPRLGFSWQIDQHAFTTAQAYFALCGHGIMAGGLFAIAFRDGSLWASFDAGIDLLMGWKPYHYDMSYRLHIRAGIGSMSVGLGVDVRFWGPDFGCEFTLKIIVVKVTIKIGDQSSRYPDAIDWAEFQEAYLPSPEDVCSIAVVDGLTKQMVRDPNGTPVDVWVINPKSFELATDSLIPSKTAQVKDTEENYNTADGFGVFAMGIHREQLETAQTVTIQRIENGGSNVDIEEQFRLTAITKCAPTAIWGETQGSGDHIVPPEVNDPPFVDNVFYGFSIVPQDPPEAGETHVIGVEHLLYDTFFFDDAYVWDLLEAFVADTTLGEEGQRDAIRNTVELNETRDTLLEALGFDVSQVTVQTDVADSFIFAPQVRC